MSDKSARFCLSSKGWQDCFVLHYKDRTVNSRSCKYKPEEWQFPCTLCISIAFTMGRYVSIYEVLQCFAYYKLCIFMQCVSQTTIKWATSALSTVRHQILVLQRWRSGQRGGRLLLGECLPRVVSSSPSRDGVVVNIQYGEFPSDLYIHVYISENQCYEYQYRSRNV